MLNLYNLTNPSAASQPTTVPLSAGSYKWVGCYHEPPSGRALSLYANPSAGTVDACAAFCAANGNTRYFGVEYYGEC